MITTILSILAAAQPADRQTVALPPARTQWSELDDQVVELVRTNFFDAPKAADWADQHKDFGEQATDAAEFARLANRALDKLGASHTRYYTANDAGYCELRAIFADALNLKDVQCETIGADVDEDGRIRRVFAGGPASRAKLASGDRLLHADGQPFHPVTSLKGRACEKLQLRVERGPGITVDVAIEVERADPRREWLTAQTKGSFTISRDDRLVGYVPVFSCAGEEYVEALRESFEQGFDEAEALIVDLRDGWGGCNPDFLNLFNKTPPQLWFYDRERHCNNMDHQWRKPVVFLVNSRTRSGKEIIAHSVKKHKIGKLVGEPTAGAVLGGRAFALSDDSILYLAVADVQVDGERLEGEGVKPDIKVDDTPNYIGHDPQFNMALELLFSQLAGTEREESPCASDHHH